MVAKPVVRVLAKLVERRHLPLCILLVDSGATMHAQLLDVLQLLSAHEDLLLRNLDNGAIEVLKEQSVHLEHLLLDLEDLDEVDVLVHAKLVLNVTLLAHHNTVVLLGAHDDPLQVLERDLVIERNEESLIVTGEATVQVEDTTIHVNADHVTVPEVASQDGQRDDQEEGQVGTNDARVSRLLEPSVELEVVSFPVLSDDVKDEHDPWIKGGIETSPCDDLVEVLRVRLERPTDAQRAHPGHQEDDQAGEGSCRDN